MPCRAADGALVTAFPVFIETKTSPMFREREARQGIGGSISTGSALKFTALGWALKGDSKPGHH